MFNVTVAMFLYNVITGRNTKMGLLLEDELKEMIMIKEGKLGELWDSLRLIVQVKRAEIEKTTEEIMKCKYLILQYIRDEGVITVLMEEVAQLLTKSPNWEWVENN